MEIKDYILNAEEFENIKKPKKGQKKRCVRADYRVLFQSGCDFGIEKRVGKKVSRLIILVSREQYYVAEGKIIKALTVPLFRNFLKDLSEDLLLPDVYWLGGLYRDQDLPARILEALRNPYIKDMLKKGTIYIYAIHEIFDRLNTGEDGIPCFSEGHRFDKEFANPGLYHWIVNFLAERRGITKKQLFQELIGLESGKKETMLLKSFEAIRYICDLYGPEWGKRAVEKYMTSSVEDVIDIRYVRGLFDAVVLNDDSFKPVAGEEDTIGSFERRAKQIRKSKARRFSAEKLLDYMMCYSCKEGYAFSMDEFLADWIRCLEMQKEIYGKIEQKYPKNLKSALQRLSYEHKLHEEEIFNKQWAIVSDKMRELEFTDDVYLIKSPRCKNDLIYEAEHQHNCVMGYAEKVRRGEEQILFMRRCEEENKPLVTLEVLPGGRVGQIFRACNEAPSDEEMEFIRKWAEAKKLIMPVNPFPMRAADEFIDDDIDVIDHDTDRIFY